MSTPPRFLHATVSLCRACKNAVEAQVMAHDDGTVWMHKVCAQHGAQAARLSDNVTWYEETRAVQPRLTPPPGDLGAADKGCPFDCGPCELHTADIKLPVVTITSACNLNCPICYVHNKNQDAFHMSVEEFRRILDGLIRAHGGDLDIINLTGGEPTLHPELLELIVAAHDAGVHRVTVCSNGVKLARDEALVVGLGKLGARIALSFDTFEPHADALLQGTELLALKMRCLDLLEKHGVDVTLIPVMTAGVNDHEIGRILQLALTRPHIRHVEVHTITYTGQGGVDFDPARTGRISLHEVLQRIESTTDGLLKVSDFVPSPCAHPLCYQIAYLLLDPNGGPPVPLTRVLPREALYASLSEHLYLEPSRLLEEALHDAVNRLWSTSENDRVLVLLKSLLARLYPEGKTPSRQELLRLGESSIKAVYVHSHMDEETFDTQRVAQCCDSNCYADGKSVPVCAYNVLYREKEPRFMTRPRAWNERSGGDRAPSRLHILA